MFNKPDLATHQKCRSLLQKAVRRGCPDLVGRTAAHLFDIEDKSWLPSITAVITFEECWQTALRWNYSPELIDIIDQLSFSSEVVKNKQAAGLGSLAYALTQDDRSVLDGHKLGDDILKVARGLDDPKKFISRLKDQSLDESSRILLESAQKGIKKASWPWDKAFVVAAAYLAVKDGVSSIEKSDIEIDIDNFPFWAAIDKHTEDGKQVLKKTAAELKQNQNRVSWCSFYFESAVLNEFQLSNWWELEMTWRLGKTGLSIDQGIDLWHLARPIVEEKLKLISAELKEHILSSSAPVQKRLF